MSARWSSATADLTPARDHVYALRLKAARAALAVENYEAAREHLVKLSPADRERPDTLAFALEIDRASDEHALGGAHHLRRGGRQCKRGCRCGNACIYCSKRCRR